MEDFIIDIIFATLRNQSLTTLTPLKLKFFNGSTDITNDLLGYSSYSLTTSIWNVPASGQIKNASTISLGSLLTSFSGTLTLKFYDVSNNLLFSFSSVVNLISGTLFNIPTNGITIGLPNLSVELANFLLSYIFRNNTSAKPTSWYLELVNSSNSAITTRTLLSSSVFSNTYLNELGQKQVNYAGNISIPMTSDVIVSKWRLYAQASGGNVWFENINPAYQYAFNNRNINLYSNSLNIALSPKDLSTSFLLSTSGTSLFHADFDGTLEDLNGTSSIVNSSITYDNSKKLFKGESASFLTSDYVEYSNFTIPNEFVLEFFVNFSTNPVNRRVFFMEKVGVFRLEKSADNKIQIYLNNGLILENAWSPTINTWYHIFIKKTTTAVILNVNTAIDTSVALAPSFTLASNSNNLRINNSSNPILGVSAGLYLSSDTSRVFSNGTQPLPKKAYNWKYLNINNWLKLGFTQWKEYCRI